jgi:hypothetical protein
MPLEPLLEEQQRSLAYPAQVEHQSQCCHHHHQFDQQRPEALQRPVEADPEQER